MITKAGQTEFAVYRHRPHGFSDFFQISAEEVGSAVTSRAL